MSLWDVGPTVDSSHSGKSRMRIQGQAWTHNVHLESLPLWDLCLYLWVNAYKANIADNDHEMGHGHMITLIVLSSSHRARRYLGRNMSSSETTQILFNSPALHSLKRDQLVKLCKIHSIKANGKNTELIQRLTDHASTLPHGSPLSVATRSEHPQDGRDSFSSRLDSQRPSEQWEFVMEDIPELPEGSSRATLSSLRSAADNTPDEFGTGGGSKCQPSILF